MQPAKPFAASKIAAFASVSSTWRRSISAGIAASAFAREWHSRTNSTARRVQTAEALFARTELRFMMSLGRILRGWLDVLDGRPAAFERLGVAVNEWRVGDQTLHLTHGLVLLARASLLTGNLDIGRAAVREGIQWGTTHQQRYLDAEFWRVDGEILAAAGDPSRAETSVRRALAVADTQGADWLYQRAEESLRQLRSVP